MKEKKSEKKGERRKERGAKRGEITYKVSIPYTFLSLPQSSPP